MTQQRRFTKEFEDEAVRLVRTSGRSQREIAGDLGIGLSMLVQWISRSRDRQIDAPDRSGQEEVTAELKRLRRENEILRQEQDILKRPRLFSLGREVGEVRAHRCGERGVPRAPSLLRSWRQPA